MSTEQTVNDYLFKECSESLLQELADTNDYWESSYNFVKELRNNKVDLLTYRQKTWLMKIKSGLLGEAEKN